MLVFWKLMSATVNLKGTCFYTFTLVITPEDFPDEVRADAGCDLMLEDETCQHWARLHNFPPHLYFRRFIKGELKRNEDKSRLNKSG